MQFYVRDWAGDPELAMCSPSTRGIWMDAICAMQARQRSGELSGKIEQLARICRCTAEEMTVAVAELRSTGAADVTVSNETVTLICRRMKRESDGRRSGALRTKKHRNGNVTSAVTTGGNRCNGEVTDTRASGSEAESESKLEKDFTQTPGGVARGGPTKEQVIAAGKRISCSPEECERFWLHYESVGWVTIHNQPIPDWESRLALWNRDTRKPKHPKEKSTHGITKAGARSDARSRGDRNAGNANAQSKSQYDQVEKLG